MSQPSVEHILSLIDQLPEADREIPHAQIGGGNDNGNSAEQSEESSIEQAIEASRHLMQLEQDWDGEGSPGYTEETWKRATEFIQRYSGSLLVEHGFQIAVPEILPGPGGSIDVHWEKDAFELLVNIPADAGERAEFYGDDYGSIYIKGNLDLSKLNKGLVEWLQREN